MPAYIFPQQEQVAHQIRTALRVFAESEAAIRPHFHLTGPSGSGKSYLLKSLGEELGLPMIELKAVIKLLQAQNKDLNIGIRLLNSCVHQHFMSQVR